MYSVVICSCISLCGRSDFVGVGLFSLFTKYLLQLFVGTAIWALFIHDKKTDILEYLNLLYTIIATLFYDFLWLYFHSNVGILINFFIYQSFFKGSNYENAEGGLTSFAYFVSFVNFVCKIVLLVTLWIQYNVATHKKTNEPKQIPNSSPRTNNINNNSVLQIGTNYQSGN